MTFDSNENPLQALTAQEADAGTRIDVFIARELKVSRERAKKILQTATIGDLPIKSSHVLKEGEEVVFKNEAATVVREGKAPRPIAEAADLPPIIFEDEHLIVISKPRGLVVHEGAGEQGSTLVEILLAGGRELSSVGPPERAGIVHRLDKDTSGVMAICKTDAAHWKLAADFAERRVRKEYSALVCGVPRCPGRIEAPLDRHPKNRKKMAVVASGRNAITEYSITQNWQRFALLNVSILTGRTHQIRVHLAYVNYPVAGDAVYGGLTRALENAPNDNVKAAIENLHGQALHAAHLSFAHPISGEPLSFHAPIPDVMARIIDALNEA